MALNYDSLSSLTKDKFIPVLVDNIFNSNVLTFRLLKNAEKITGGKKIITPVEYGVNGAQGFYNGYDVLDTTPSDPFSAAEWDWKMAYATISISGEDELKNSGDSQVLSLLKAKVKNAEKSLKDLFGTKLYSTAPDAKEITALGDGSAGDGDVMGQDRVLGGIDSTTYTWWDSQDVAVGEADWDKIVDSTEAGYIQKHMRRMYGLCSIDNDHPTLIVTSRILFDAYEATLTPQKRFTGDSKLADAGFENLAFKGASVVIDDHCPAGIMYFLNENYLDFKVHPKRNFTFESFQKPINQDAQVAKILWMGNLTCTNPRMQGFLDGLPTAY